MECLLPSKNLFCYLSTHKKVHNKFTRADQSPPVGDLEEVVQGEIDMLHEIQ